MKLGLMILSLLLEVGRPVVKHPLEDIYFKNLSACSLKVIGLCSQNTFTFLAWSCSSATVRPILVCLHLNSSFPLEPLQKSELVTSYSGRANQYLSQGPGKG